jgi:ribosomal protein L37AE/L43A
VNDAPAGTDPPRCPTCHRKNTTKGIESLLREIHICRDCLRTFVIEKPPLQDHSRSRPMLSHLDGNSPVHCPTCHQTATARLEETSVSEVHFCLTCHQTFIVAKPPRDNPPDASSRS